MALATSPSKPATGKTAAAKLWSNEYWAQKGDVKLYMFRKRATAPRAGEAALPAASVSTSRLAPDNAGFVSLARELLEENRAGHQVVQAPVMAHFGQRERPTARAYENLARSRPGSTAVHRHAAREL